MNNAIVVKNGQIIKISNSNSVIRVSPTSFTSIYKNK